MPNQTARRWPRYLWWIPILLVLLYLLAGYFFAGRIVYPQLLTLAEQAAHTGVASPADLGMAFRDVEMITRDSLHLRGWWVAPVDSAPGPVVILVHGIGTNRVILLDYARFLVPAGYRVLLYDARGHGLSDRAVTTFGATEWMDVEAAVLYAKRQPGVDSTRVFAFGCSMGASITASAAGRMGCFRGLILDSSYRDFPAIVRDYALHSYQRWILTFVPTAVRFAEMRGNFDADSAGPAIYLPSIKCPIFFIHGLADRDIRYTYSVDDYAMTSAPKALWLVPGADHVSSVVVDPKGYARRVLSFLDDPEAYCADPTPQQDR